MKIDNIKNITGEKDKQIKKSENKETKDNTFLNLLSNGGVLPISSNYTQNPIHSQIYQSGLSFIDNDFDLNDLDFSTMKSSYKYNVLTMDREDAKFFAHKILGKEYSFSTHGNSPLLMQNIMNVEDNIKTYKSANVSKTLINMLSDSMQTNKPVRIDFGNDISAILRVDASGKISAQFIPADKVAEEYLKNNLSYLQEVFDKEDIEYNELSYKQSENNKRQRKYKREEN